MHLERLVRFVSSQPWALTQSTMATMLEVLRYRASGDRLSAEEIQARLAAAAPRSTPAQSGGGIAVIGIRGIISQHAPAVDDVSSPGGASCEAIARLFRSALADPAAGSILFDVDSPGGSVLGMCELADEIRAARGQKRMVAISRSEMCSAAYTIGSAADEIVAMPMSNTGSIGVWGGHTDYSAALEREGIKTTLVYSGKYKVEGNPYEPLSEEAKAEMQKACDEAYDLMTSTVAKNRGVSTKVVRGELFGQGRIFGAKEAVANGLADRVDTLEGTIARLQKGGRKSGGSSAEDLGPEISAETDVELRLRSLQKKS